MVKAQLKFVLDLEIDEVNEETTLENVRFEVCSDGEQWSDEEVNEAFNNNEINKMRLDILSSFRGEIG